MPPVMPQDEAVIGCTGKLLIGSRGSTGSGEILVRVRGGSETLLASPEDPLPTGATVLESRGCRAVGVIEWTDPLDALVGWVLVRPSGTMCLCMLMIRWARVSLRTSRYSSGTLPTAVR